MKLEVYGANLRVGGAVVSAASLVHGLVDLLNEDPPTWLQEAKIVISPQMERNLNQELAVTQVLPCEIKVREDTPKNSRLRFPSWNPDLRYVLFGPDYARPSRGIRVSGFADGTLIPAWHSQTTDFTKTIDFSRIFNLPRVLIKKRLLASFDGFVVQSEGMAQSLREAFPGRAIAVIPNTLAPPFSYPHLRRQIDLPSRAPNEFRLFYPAKGYPHKNHVLLPHIAHAFHELYLRRLTFVTTLSKDEFKRLFPKSPSGILNLGPIEAAALPSLYEQTDGLFMPSSNETFSSSPLEASFMRKPTLVSDLPFFREVLGGYAVYWDMVSPESAAKLIHAELKNQEENDSQQHDRIEAARVWAHEHAASVQMARRHLDFLRQMTMSGERQRRFS